MFIIMDERTNVSIQQTSPGDYPADHSVNLKLIQMAEYVVVISDDSYRVLKDRFTGITGEYPLDELPDVIKSRLVACLKARDQVSTDE